MDPPRFVAVPRRDSERKQSGIAGLAQAINSRGEVAGEKYPRLYSVLSAGKTYFGRLVNVRCG